MKMLLLMAYLVLIPFLSAAQGIEIIRQNPGVIEAFPSEKVTLVFEVKNNFKETHNFTSELILPAEWEILEKDLPFPFELASNGSQMRLLSFFIPAQTNPGTYAISYIVKDTDNALLREKISITIRVLPPLPVALSITSSPSYVIAGEEIITSFLIRNTSDKEIHIEFFLYSSQNYPLYLLNTTETVLSLYPHADMNLDVVIQTDESISKNIQHTLELSVFSLDETDVDNPKNRPLTIKNTVTIIHTTAEEKVLYHSLPVQITVKHMEQVYDRWNGDIQATLSGFGTFDAEENHHIDFRLHKIFDIPADEEEVSTYDFIDDEDEYSLRYYSDFLDLYLGDHFYSISPLTEEFCYGRGAMATVYLDSFSVMALYHQSLWDEPVENHVGGFITYSLLDDFYPDGFIYTASLHCFGSVSAVKGTSPDYLFDYYDPEFLGGMYMEYYPTKEINLSCDVNAGRYLIDNSEWGFAYLLAGEYYGDLFLCDITFIQGLPDFPGYYSDAVSFTANGGINLFDKSFQLNTGYMQSTDNDTIGEDIITTEYKRVKCGFNLNALSTLTYIYFMWELTHNYCHSYYEEHNNSFTVVFDQPFGLFSLNGFAFVELVNDLRDSSLRIRQQYKASFYLRPLKNMTLTLAMSYIDHNYDRDDVYVPEDEEEGIEDIDFIVSCNVSYQFNNHHSVSLEALYNYSEDYDRSIELVSKHELRFTIGYNISLDVPVNKKRIAPQVVPM
jgi:hypothetical protein